MAREICLRSSQRRWSPPWRHGSSSSRALGEATAVDGDVVFWGVVGASMLFGAARGDAGCELLAIPNAITGRRDRIGCILLMPIDAAEAGRGRGQVAGQGVR